MNQQPTTTQQAIMVLLQHTKEHIQADPDAWRRSAGVDLINKIMVTLSQPTPPAQPSAADLLVLDGLQRQLNQALATLRDEKGMRQKVFKAGNPRRHDKLAAIDQVSDTLTHLARRAGLRTPADRPAVAAQASLFGGGA